MKAMKRCFSVLLVFAMLFGFVPWTEQTTKAATGMTLAQLQQKFPNGDYWNHYVNKKEEASDYLKKEGVKDEKFADYVSQNGCSYHVSKDLQAFVGHYDCNYFDGGVQCCGFARRLAYLAYGTGTRASSWTTTSVISQVKSGDVVKWKTGTNSWHWVFVTSVSGSTITVGECNVYNTDDCRIRWGQSYDLNSKSSVVVYSAPYEWSGAGITEGNTPANLGDKFTAPILNKVHWKIIENNNGVVQTASEVGLSRQLWYFERQSDGSYKISSCYDGRCLDVANASNASGAKVCVVEGNNTNAQRWYIYEEDGGYILKAKCTDCVLDLPNNDPTNGNHLQMYTKNGSGAQNWAIYRGSECVMQAPKLSVSPGNSTTKTTFTWNNVYGETGYHVKIWKGTLWEGDAYHVEWDTSSGYGIQLPTGTYQAYVDVSNFFETKMSNVVTFTVTQPTLTIDTRYPTPFKANTRLWWNTSDGRTPVYDAVNGNQKGYIYNGYNNEDDHCTIEEVYTNGWCKVTVPGLDGARYCLLSVFVYPINGYNPWEVVSPSRIDAYRRWDHGSPSGYISQGDKVFIISETDTMYQTIYPTSNGYVSRWVDRCALAHLYTAKKTEPSCTTQGYTTHTCKFCGYSYKDTYVNATGHSYSYKATKNPTASATGTLTGTCSKCKGTTTVTLPKLNTTDYTYAVKTAATCTAAGTGRYTWKTTTYGSFYFDETITAKGHSYTSKVTAPTCTAQGYTTHTCSCGHSYKDTYKNATGHSYSYKATKNPTASATGTLTGTCSKCKGTTTVTLPKLNTTDYTYAVKTAATCTAAGTGRYTWKTTTYGSFYFDETITAKGHSYTSKVTAPTCTAQGYTTHTCSCGHSYKDTYKNATGHSYGYTVTKNPTASATGTLTGTCSKCKGTTTVTLPKLNTTDYTYAVKTAATCTADGTGSYTWNTTEYGNFSFNVSLTKTGHSFEDGLCTVCGGEDPDYRFTVVYNANGGTGVPASQTKISGITLTLSTTRPTRFGYNFIGWSTSSSATTATYQPGGSFSVSADTTLYAVWSAAETVATTTETYEMPKSTYGKVGYYYKFTPTVSTSYSLNIWDGDEEGIVSITLYDSDENILAKIAGTDAEAFSEFDCTLEYVAASDKTYYIYLEFTDTDDAYVYLIVYRGYLLSYNANGGSNAPSQQYFYFGNGDHVISSKAPSRTGYTFIEWNTRSDGPGNAYHPGDKLDEGWENTTLYAVWEKNQPTITLKYPSLSFKDEVKVNVYYEVDKVDDVVDMGLIVYGSQVDSYTVYNAESVSAGYRDSNGLYCVTTKGIPAKNMSDTIWFAVYAKLSDGSYCYSKLVSYSPREYAYTMLGTDAKLDALLVAMLSYGAAAQTYFNYRTDDLINKDLTAEQKALAGDFRSNMMSEITVPDTTKQGGFVSNGGFDNKYPSVTFGGAFAINYYCIPSYVPVGEITMYYWREADYNAADVLTVENATGMVEMNHNGNTYRGSVTGISAKDLGDGVYIAIVYSDGNTTYSSGVLQYSIGMYCNTMASYENAFKPLAQATAVYGYYAKQYFG